MYKHRNRTKREKDMRQKYVISRDGAKNKLKIREYANRIDDLLKSQDSSKMFLICSEMVDIAP